MKDNYKWDLQDLLQGKSLEYLHEQWLNKQNEILKLYPFFLSNLNNFKQWLKLEEEFDVLSNRLNNYISNNYNEDLVNPLWISWSQRLSNESNTFSVKLSDCTNRILDNEKLIKNYLRDKSINKYQRAFVLIFKTKPHILKKDQEQILSKASIFNGGFSTIFSTLSDSDLKFKDAVNTKGKKVHLKTIADITLNLKSKDRTLRKSTWINFNQAYANYESTFTQTLYYNYLMLNTISKIRNFNDYIHATAFNDEIDVKLITTLYENVASFKPIIKRYHQLIDKLLKKQLKLNNLEPWDKNVELSKTNHTYTIEETKKIIIESLKPLGNGYINNIKKAFNEHWISWLPKQNKQTGAYSIGGTKGLNKYYISMNFDKTIRSIETIAHELGHSMNSLYINKKQKIYANTSIFWAEISSIVNEILLSYYLLDKYQNDKDMSKIILDGLIRNFFATTTRQIIFSNTEYILNNYVNESKSFTKESIKQAYIEMIDKYEGIRKKDKYKKIPYAYSLSTILRIPHFYAGNFYVYKYAIGQIVALVVAEEIHKNNQDMINKYFNFLSSGDSKSPIDTIKILGIDLYNEEVYIKAKTTISNWINNLGKFVKY